MRLLVTGGAGFIGANFVRYVLRTTRDVDVVNLDALTYAGNPASLADLADDARYRFVHGDVRDAALMGSLAAEADAVAHFAAETHVDRSIDAPARFLETNVVGTAVVFDACRDAGVERVLHVSTDEVYGSIEPPGRFVESDPLRPNSPYAASKAAADLLARAYRQTYDFPVIVTRATNTFGPYHYPEKVVPLFITNLIDGVAVPLYGDGSQAREWTYVEDNVAAQWLALTDGEPGSDYNVGSGEERTNRELTDAILEAMGVGAEHVEHVADRPGHDRRYAVDSTRIRGLGWEPSVGFDEALARTVAWYRRNEAWWRPLKRQGASTRRGSA